jgi:hypothetical protein
LFIILTDAKGFCEKPQMPPFGPMITDAGYKIALSDGTVVNGDQIIKDIHNWLAAGALDD